MDKFQKKWFIHKRLFVCVEYFWELETVIDSAEKIWCTEKALSDCCKEEKAGYFEGVFLGADFIKPLVDSKIFKKHRDNINESFDDDSALFTNYGEKILAINGSKENLKKQKIATKKQ